MRETNCETVTLESNGKVRQFKPSAKGKWDVLVSSTMQLSVGDQIRVTAGFREGKNVFKNNDVAQVREITRTSDPWLTKSLLVSAAGKFLQT